ncbi:hypothetical protein [Metapseudomonas otitidis]|uniref:hypothetical protein n=1 Tax=Metapseudomonas otitidis TaxID=319939 RepID=UPI0013F5B69C|nr:hypothetical protein [Pseudomonas otitidis]
MDTSLALKRVVATVDYRHFCASARLPGLATSPVSHAVCGLQRELDALPGAGAAGLRSGGSGQPRAVLFWSADQCQRFSLNQPTTFCGRLA